MKTSTLLTALLVLFVSGCALFKPAPPETPVSSTSEKYIDGHAQQVVNEAEDKIGTSYKYGGNNPREGFDCSGLTVWVYDQAADIQLPRTSATQAKVGHRIRTNQAQAGDLAVFRSGGRVFHVGIVVDSDSNQLWIVHSTTSRGVIREEILGSSYWAPKLSEVRRLLR